MLKVIIMKRTKLFINGKVQAVHLSKGFQFSGDDVLIQKAGNAAILLLHDRSREVFLHSLNNFTDDFMKEGHNQGKNRKRELHVPDIIYTESYIKRADLYLCNSRQTTNTHQTQEGINHH